MRAFNVQLSVRLLRMKLCTVKMVQPEGVGDLHNTHVRNQLTVHNDARGLTAS